MYQCTTVAGRIIRPTYGNTAGRAERWCSGSGWGEGASGPGWVHAACWSHARRKFFEALRWEQARPVLDIIKQRVEEASGKALPASALGRAAKYTLALWPRLTRFLEHPELELSNNLAENSMRPVALGRKNWIHPGSKDAGPKVAAILSISKPAADCRSPRGPTSPLSCPVWQVSQSQDFRNSRRWLGPRDANGGLFTTCQTGFALTDTDLIPLAERASFGARARNRRRERSKWRGAGALRLTRRSRRGNARRGSKPGPFRIRARPESPPTINNVPRNAERRPR